LRIHRSWEPPHATGRQSESDGICASISDQADGFSLEAHYRGELNPLSKRAAGAILKAAVIQMERCSRRAWQFDSAGEKESAERMNSIGAGSTYGQMSEKARSQRADITHTSSHSSSERRLTSFRPPQHLVGAPQSSRLLRS
jgi:hypothetical protein